MENVVLSVFAVESEAYQAMQELRLAPAGTNYVVAGAALIRNDEGKVSVLDAFNISGNQVDDTAAGMIIGTLVGVLGGPFGVLLGATTGAAIGSLMDTDDTLNNLTGLEVLANKIFEGEIAVVALVQEEEPAFDAAFAKYDTTIMRYDAADIAAQVESANQLEDEATREAYEQAKTELREKGAARREEHKAAIKAHFNEYVDATNRTMGNVQ